MFNEVICMDFMLVKYYKGDDGQFCLVVDEKEGQEIYWNIECFSLCENLLVIFILLIQVVMGVFIVLFLVFWLGMDSIVGFEFSIMFILMLVVFMVIQVGVLVLFILYLGKLLCFYCGFNNLKYLLLLWEVLGVVMFFVGMVGYIVFKLVNIWLEWVIVEWLV